MESLVNKFNKSVSAFWIKYRHPFLMGLIFICSLICFSWIGYHDGTVAATYSKGEIVNDDYSVLSPEITDEKGINQNIQVKAYTELHGVKLDIHTFNRIQHGTVFIKLIKDNQVIASCQEDMQFLLDNTFRGFIFDKSIYSETDEKYILNISIEPQEPGVDKLALWQSKQAYEGFELTDNDNVSYGTAAIQYIESRVGNNIYKYLIIFFIS